MVSHDPISDSEADSDSMDLVYTPKKDKREETTRELSMPSSGLSHRFREPPESPIEQPRARNSSSEENRIAVMVQPPARPWEYQPIVEEDTVDAILAEIDQPGGRSFYRIEYEDGRRDDVSYTQLLKLRNGRNALAFYDNGGDAESLSSMEVSDPSSSGKRTRRQTQRPGFVDSRVSISDDEITINKKRRLAKNNEEDSDSPLSHSRATLSTRAGASKIAQEPHKLADDDDDSDSILYDVQQKRKPANGRQTTITFSKAKKGRSRRMASDSESSPERLQPTRKSGRAKVSKSMKEHDVDEEVYADEVVVTQKAKTTSVREIFQPLAKKSPFTNVHQQHCEACRKSSADKGILVFCQGCSVSIHEVCLGYRSTRDHRVTKIGHEDFVLQCKYCIRLEKIKQVKEGEEPLPKSPQLDTCQVCKESGLSCAAFSTKKSSKEEQKVRADNDGDDPIAEVSPKLVNNVFNVLFRCTTCHRPWHFEHLPPLDKDSDSPDDLEQLRDARHEEYLDWHCKDCLQHAGENIGCLVAWRPVDRNSYVKGQAQEDFREDDIEYLIKWDKKSYHKCTWEPGAWVFSVAAPAMRNAFFKRNGLEKLKFTSEEAIAEDFLRIEIIMDVDYERYNPKSAKSDKVNIDLVKEIFVKFEGLGYNELVWDDPPARENTDRWREFEAAYDEYLAGRYFQQVSTQALERRIDDFRRSNFVELKAQPPSLVGGEMMGYQLEGMNWLLYNFHSQKNVILADEMGLGKTIQVIGFLAALIKHKPKSWPFLIVTPNSTCPNWRREIQKWAPDIRVVAYYGGQENLDNADKYELFPDGHSKGDMRAHVVVTSYDTPVKYAAWFKKIKWMGVIVDEGQRLKNDENLLYAALTNLNFPFKGLLTGTPLQNNKRELFNLLHFCKPELNAAKLDAEYAELDTDKVAQLHALIRPFFLRRTKAQALKFLPPMVQVIVPVTMSIVQKKLYKSILEKKPELIKALFDNKGNNGVPKTERGSLNNLLMQLRKTLCHPFVYSRAIEGRIDDPVAAKRSLIDASSKLQLLEVMLPKLRERGHRVLLFSQFLEQLTMLEDFLATLNLPYERLDGMVNAMEKQRRIDRFNAPGSDLFAFLLSTRAGGVGINLATADTVIVMDPDFNPHQDIQAFSRAHRIGQKKNVLVFQLMTKGSAEEKITQIGQKKMALDHVLIENMNDADDAGEDVESILKHGAKALFDNDDTNDIRYDSASIDKLLDRSTTEVAELGEGKTTDSQWSHARVWLNNEAGLADNVGNADAEEAAPADWWTQALEEREAKANAANLREAEVLGRGKMRSTRRAAVYDAGDAWDDNGNSPEKRRSKRSPVSDEEMDFDGGGESGGDDDEKDGDELVDPRELETQTASRSRSIANLQRQQQPHQAPQVSTTTAASKAPVPVKDPARAKHPSIAPPTRKKNPVSQFPGMLATTSASGKYVTVHGGPSQPGSYPDILPPGAHASRVPRKHSQPATPQGHHPYSSAAPLTHYHSTYGPVNSGAGVLNGVSSAHMPGASVASVTPSAALPGPSHCPICHFPHLRVTATCHHSATAPQARLIIDYLQQNFPTHNAQYIRLLNMRLASLARALVTPDNS